jgi:negative regulator of flagellin synthesis FlgM
VKINHIGTSGMNPYKRQMNKLDNVASTINKSDRVEISSEAKELQHVLSIEKEREIHVDQIKKQLQAGKYNIDPREIGKGIIRYYSR